MESPFLTDRKEISVFDLSPAALEMSRIVSAVGDDQLDRPTPCTEWTVRDLLAHLQQFAAVFTANARKTPTRPPEALAENWRTAVPVQLDELARAWREPSAWQGRVSAGGVEMDASSNAVVAVEELAMHAWDLARAMGQEVHPDEADLDQVDRFFELFAVRFASGDGPFRPAVGPPVRLR